MAILEKAMTATLDKVRREGSTVMAVVVKPVVVFVALIGSCLQATEYHVSVTGSDRSDGSKARPFKTISAAARVAQPGDVVIVHEGVYRERVNPPRGGESDTKRIVYQAAPGEKVVIKGSEIIKDWKREQGDTWKVTLPNGFFGDYNPYNDIIKGEWHRHPGYPRHTGTVYVNGTWMDEAKTKSQVAGPVRKTPFWIAEVGKESTTIWAQFKDVDPNAETVEINVRQSVFYPDKQGCSYITVRGFTMRHAATPWSGAMSEQVGLIGTHWSKGWIIENNTISHSMNTGIALGRYDLVKTHGVPLPPATAPGFVKSCELALENGWSKEKIGSHIVRNNHISHCEKNGIHGSLGGIFSTIENNIIHDIAVRGWISGPDVAGLKLLASNDVLIKNNHFFRCRGHGGVWMDWMAQGTRITGNLLHDNSNDLYMEVDHGPFLIDNNLFLSRNAIRDWSQGSAYAHNLIAGNLSSRGEKRQTPYFRPHTMKEMKLSNIQHRDVRYHNNVFVGGNGLAAYAKGGKLQESGNIYLKDVGVKVEQTPDGVWVTAPQDPAWAGQERAVVTTELLGKAKIPNAPFVNRDGSPYKLDTDYFGKKRNARWPAHGPFQLSTGSRILVWPKE